MKKLLVLLLTAACALCLAFALVSTGCNPTTETNQVQTDNNSTNHQTTNPSTPSNPTNPSNPNEIQTDKNKYSSILQTLFSNDYYVKLAYQVMDESRTLTKEMLPIPYNFLREKGKNVDAYLDGTLNAFASSYMYADDLNNLYVSVKAENLSTSTYGNYYTNYVLKYKLTDQESEEYIYLCKDESLQGLLFIQELDIQKKPEILTEVNIAKYSYDRAVEDVPSIVKNLSKYDKVEIDFGEASIDNITLLIRKSTTQNYNKNTVGKLELDLSQSKMWSNPREYDNNVLYYGDPLSADYVLDKYASSMENIIAFGYGQRIKHAVPYDFALYDEAGNKTHNV